MNKNTSSLQQDKKYFEKNKGRKTTVNERWIIVPLFLFSLSVFSPLCLFLIVVTSAALFDLRTTTKVDSCCVYLWECMSGGHVQPNDLSWGFGCCICFMTCHKNATRARTHARTAWLRSGLYIVRNMLDTEFFVCICPSQGLLLPQGVWTL